MNHGDAIAVRGAGVQRVIGGAVINHDDLEGVVGLAEDAVECGSDELGLVVECDDHAYERTIRHVH